MGRKIHPLGFRLGINQKHYSYWFAKPKDYPKFIEEDEKIRTCIEKYMEKHVKNAFGNGGVGHIEIQRKTDPIRIEIHTGFPDPLVDKQNLGIDQPKFDIERLLGYKNQKIQIALSNIVQPYGNPRILAGFIASQLTNRVAFRRTMKKAIELVGETDNKGIKIQIAGRLNGSEMARVEWAREGRVPLQTVRAHIDYSYHPAQTIYGVPGTKIWIFRDAK
uniref:ribosomal protein S3 n=1 Tax=Anemia phyllitidis TaxID=12940 RepID=UPI0021ABE60A|nr:ribosomal protein S3 [Anemia phyllitidis]UUL71112.1 ribosomal protein S3 [Anemia phyllitidis]